MSVDKNKISDDVLASLIARIEYLERRIDFIEIDVHRLEVSSRNSDATNAR
jgi:hypothetical protein